MGKLIVARCYGQELVIDQDDVESYEMCTPRDVGEDGRLGQQHITVAYHLKPGVQATWVDA